jgi:hypothetical protein
MLRQSIPTQPLTCLELNCKKIECHKISSAACHANTSSSQNTGRKYGNMPTWQYFLKKHSYRLPLTDYSVSYDGVLLWIAYLFFFVFVFGLFNCLGNGSCYIPRSIPVQTMAPADTLIILPTRKLCRFRQTSTLPLSFPRIACYPPLRIRRHPS